MEETTTSFPCRVWHAATTPQACTRDIGLLLLRVVVGLLMLTQHGWGKLLSFGERSETWADPIGLGGPVSMALAIFAEVICSALVVVGLGTRMAAIPVVITMAVAAGIVHWDDPFGKKEFALLFLMPFLTLVLTGAGRYSIDGWLSRRGKTTEQLEGTP